MPRHDLTACHIFHGREINHPVMKSQERDVSAECSVRHGQSEVARQRIREHFVFHRFSSKDAIRISSADLCDKVVFVLDADDLLVIH